MDLDILHEDNHIIVLKKSAKIPVQSSRTGQVDMVSILKNYLFQQNPDKGEPYLGIVHRLDQPVEGVMVFAKTPFAAKELSGQIKQGEVDKHYLAVVYNNQNQKKADTLENYLLKEKQGNYSRVAAETVAGSKRACLNYKTLQENEELSLLEVELLTGRHHQIRVQLSHARLPIWGDTKYNQSHKEEQKWTQIGLCSYKIQIVHPKSKKVMKFQIEPQGEIFKKFGY